MLAFNKRCVYVALALGACSCSSPVAATDAGADASPPDATRADASGPQAEGGGDATVDAGAPSGDADGVDGADASESGPNVAAPGAPCAVGGATACSPQAPDSVLTCSGNPLVWTASHSCLGGGCQTGACQPVVLASGQGYPMTIVVDSTSVYWTDSFVGDAGAVMRLLLDGGDGSDGGDGGGPTQIVNAGYSAYGLAVDGTNVYWSNRYGASGVAEVSLDGGTPTVLARCTGGTQCMAVAVAGSQVYFATTQTATGDLRRVSVGGGDASLLTPEESNASGASFALSAAGIYWPGNQSLLWVPLDGGAPVPVATSVAAQGVAVDDANVYWTDVWNGIGASSVMRLSFDGGSPVAVASQLNSPQAIAVDSAGVYWTDYTTFGPSGNGAVLMAPLDGGAAVVLATAQSSPMSIAVDDTRVYWVNAGATENSGTVMAVAKP